MNEEKLIEYFQRLENEFNDAVVSNNAEEMRKCVTKDWVLVGSNGILSRERFFQVVEEGVLTHSTMTKEVHRVQVYGDIAIVTGRGQNTGTWQSNPMEADEWITDIYKKENGRWLCVLTHLTAAKE